MAGLTDFISRIFSTDQTQGLSGGAEVVIDRDPASAFYASRLRKHRTDEDLVETPTWLWATVSFQGRKGGLRAHVHAERGDGVASFTDVLVVLSQADARRAAQTEGEPWTERAARAISEKFSLYCQRERFELLYGTRPLRFWFVADGGQDMLGHSFGLGPGEFITGLLPNLYVGPAPRSRPVLAIHLHLPGQWEGYREVGRLFSDQILYTLGRHWLDNFRHPALKEPGLYRLQQYPDGSLVHVISPELQDRYFVRSDALEGGASVLTLAERSGAPVAYLVLAVVETPEMVEPGMTQGVPLAALRASGVDPTTVEVRLDDEVDAARPATGADSSGFRREMLQRTIIPDAVDSRMLTLHERGALLQKVHFGNFMEGYDVYIGTGGRIATQMPSPSATLQVRGGRVFLLVQDTGVRVDGRAATLGKPMPLSGAVRIEVDGHVLEYRDLSGVRAEGWPYVGELRRSGAGTYLDFGGVFRLGRDRRCQVRLPDEPHNENIAWLPSVGGGTTIRSRTGDIPKSRFYTDSIMVASEHAELDLSAEPVLRSLARHCHTFVRRDGAVIGLAPREASEGAHEIELLPNDEVLVGNCLFQVSYPPSAGTEQPVAPPAPEMVRSISPEELASLVDAPAPVDAAPVTPLLDAAGTTPLGIPAPGPTDEADEETRAGPRNIDLPVLRAPARAGLAALGVEDKTALDLEGRPAGDASANAGATARRLNPTATYDPVVAAGLGEQGPAPRPPRFRAPPPPASGPLPPLPTTAAPSIAAASPGAPDPTAAGPGAANPSAPSLFGPSPGAASPAASSTASAARAARLRNAASLPDLDSPPPAPPPATGPARLGLAGAPVDAPPAMGPARLGLAGAPVDAPPAMGPARLGLAGAPVDAPVPEKARRPSGRDPDPARPPPPMLLEEPAPATVKNAPATVTSAPPAGEPEDSLFEELEGLDPNDPVLSVEEARWKVELARPARLVQVGWMVSGDAVIGNHQGAQVVVPEVRAFREQAFMTLDYFRLTTRGRRGKLELLQEGEARLLVKGVEVDVAEDLDDVTLTIVRRDTNLEPDFDVTLRIHRDDTLPDPRARLISVDAKDRLVMALFTLGFPLRADRRTRVGPMTATFRFNGAQLRIVDYLPSYRGQGRFLPFFLRSGDKPWQTFPEDGSRVELEPGDGLILGNAVYRFQT